MVYHLIASPCFAVSFVLYCCFLLGSNSSWHNRRCGKYHYIDVMYHCITALYHYALFCNIYMHCCMASCNHHSFIYICFRITSFTIISMHCESQAVLYSFRLLLSCFWYFVFLFSPFVAFSLYYNCM